MAERILIAEDDNELRELLKIVLREEGFAVATCANGQLAIDYLTKAKKDGTLPEILILDLNMPVVDGWQVSEWVHNDPDLKDILIGVISANHETGQAAKALHADAYLVKPFTSDEILGLVELFSLLRP